MDNHKEILVVTANGAAAKFYKVTHFPKLDEIHTLVHPESRLHNRDLVSEGPGKTAMAGGTRRASFEPKNSAHRIEVHKFAKTVADYIEHLCQTNKYFSIYLLAGSDFLGVLRPHLGTKTQEYLTLETAKDITDQNKSVVEKHLSELREKSLI